MTNFLFERLLKVYAALSKYGRAVAGGREGSVGVAGLLLGGGNTFFTARLGFACDTVLAYEVVLADGRVIVAGTPSGEENEQHADLFHVLKGGGNNFGIVTKFTMRTIPCSDIWGGGAIMIPSLVMPRAVHNFVDFTNNIQYDPDSNLIFMLGHLSSAQEPNVVIATLYANMAGVEKPPIFERFLAFPEALTTYKKTTITDLLTITAQPTGY
jgi:hypothetical protein